MTISSSPLPQVSIDWPSPARVQTLCTTRRGGVSAGVWGLPQGKPGGLNLGVHVGDQRADVDRNRMRVSNQVGVPIVWMNQVHGTTVLDADAMADLSDTPTADAAVCTRTNRALCIMTADCLPVLLSDSTAACIGAAHAGWRGLVSGVLEATVSAMRARLPKGARVQAWLGPAIGPAAFEVGDEVRAAFIGHDPRAASAFRAAPAPDKWLADLFLLARMRLHDCGVTDVYGEELCTVSDPHRFYSHRRDRVSGRMASLIWISA